MTGMFLLGLTALQQAAVAPDQGPSELPAIVVEGEAAPEPEAVLGSRVARPREDFGNGQIATATGVAGLGPGSGMDPFAGRASRLVQRECRSDPPLAEEIACAFGEAQKAFEAGDYGVARAAIDRLLSRPALGDEGRYLAYRAAFALALRDGDARDRVEALEGMLATEAMPTSERAPALRSLASLALDAGDRTGAAVWFERAAAADPRDARTLGNLAALYAEAGRGEEALALIGRAITLVRAAGEAVPPGWIAFAEGR